MEEFAATICAAVSYKITSPSPLIVISARVQRGRAPGVRSSICIRIRIYVYELEANVGGVVGRRVYSYTGEYRQLLLTLLNS